jgi:hypothetical protein
VADRSSLPARTKAALYARIWRLALEMEIAIRRRPLPQLIEAVGTRGPARSDGLRIGKLRRAVDRTLRVGGWEPRCLVKALVLYQLLAEQGIEADLVIGLPDHRRGTIAHAWVEVEGRDVGPNPGRSGHEEFARFGTGAGP